MILFGALLLLGNFAATQVGSAAQVGLLLICAGLRVTGLCVGTDARQYSDAL